MKVSLKNWQVKSVDEAISHAAFSCYERNEPVWGEKIIDIKNNLFKTGHHTTMQHTYFTFFIERISVGDVTLGLHLANSFYNSSQRSGRFCSEMFLDPDIEEIKEYIQKFWDLKPEILNEVTEYVSQCLNIYSENLDLAIKKTEEFLREDRPKMKEKSFSTSASKIAQEQMRVFIPVIFPTGLEYTVNLSVAVALYRSAESPPMKEVTKQMKNLILSKYPKVAYMFERDSDKQESSLVVPYSGFYCHAVRGKPTLKLLSRGCEDNFVKPKPEELHPVDLLHFLSKFMPNNIEQIKTRISVSIATMGQDQRHRTIKRGQPCFTGEFYLPPVPSTQVYIFLTLPRKCLLGG